MALGTQAGLELVCMSVLLNAFCCCRYYQLLVDMEIELAKSRGTYDKGVMFLDKGVSEVQTETVWKHPQPEGGEVSSFH